jgi:hypothetical protein
VHKRTDFRALHRLDEKIADALAAGDGDRAIAHLQDGVERARLLSEEGSVELATVAWTSFGRRLALELRRRGERDQAARIIEEALSHVGNDADARAMLVLKAPTHETLTLDLDELDEAGPRVDTDERSEMPRTSGVHLTAGGRSAQAPSLPRPRVRSRR